jgi:CHASE3 domain sensor protein
MDDRKPRFLGGVAAAAALAVVVALGFLESRSRGQVLASAGWVSRTLHVQRELELARGLLADAETGQRGYLLTMDESYLRPNEQATAALPGVLARLRELTADNNAQQQRIGRLEQLAAARMDRIRQSVGLAKSGERDRAVKIVVEGGGNALMTDIRAVIREALADEERLLQQREAGLERSVARRGLETQILIGLMAAGLIAGVFLLVRLNRVLAVLNAIPPDDLDRLSAGSARRT